MRARGWLAALLASAFVLVAPSFEAAAQDNAASASSSADSAAGPQDIQDAEARRNVLFQQMLANPSNLDVAFEYAGLSARVGDIEAAIATLERMLIFAPGLPRLQLELGVLYYRLGAYETARSYFQSALSAPNVPDVVKARVDPYISAIDKRTKGYTFGGTATAGLRYQTNANSAPGGGIVNLNGIPFTLDEDATGVPDWNAFFNSTLNYSIDLKNQGDRFDINLSTYGAWYDKRDDINTELAELKVGPIFDLGRFGMQRSAFGLYGIASGVLLAEEPYLGGGGVGSTLIAALGKRASFALQDEYRREEYFNSDLRPTASLRSGHRFSGSARLTTQLNDRFSIFASLQGERRLTERDYLDLWQWGGSAGWILAVDSPIAKQSDNWTLGVTGGYLRRDYDGPDPAINANESEWDDEYYVVGTLNVPIRDGWGLRAQSGYRQVDSNYDTRVYDNVSGSLGVSKRF